VGSFQNLILKNYEARKDEIYMKASSAILMWNKGKMIISWAPEGQMGQMEMKSILYV
jgi:hypothetical protein